MRFLGYVISADGMTADPTKLDSIYNFPESKNIRKLHSFLGLCNFYRKLQQNYAGLTAVS